MLVWVTEEAYGAPSNFLVIRVQVKVDSDCIIGAIKVKVNVKVLAIALLT